MESLSIVAWSLCVISLGETTLWSLRQRRGSWGRQLLILLLPSMLLGHPLFCFLVSVAGVINLLLAATGHNIDLLGAVICASCGSSVFAYMALRVIPPMETLIRGTRKAAV